MPAPTLIIHAHPRPGRSQITRGLLQVLAAAPDTDCRSLYDLYPDFDIDVRAEQQALARASLVIWLAPVYWYGVPALLKHWFEQVLLPGWAYGPGGTALHGRTAWWVCSAGAVQSAYQPGGSHGRPFEDFVPPVEQTARYCGMDWLPPFVVHGGHAIPPSERAAHTRALAEALRRYRADLDEKRGGMA